MSEQANMTESTSLLDASRQGATRFEVAVFKYEGGWRVEISDPGRKRVGHGAFAAVEAHDLDAAMQMAVPYLASVSEPMPFAELLDRMGKEPDRG